VHANQQAAVTASGSSQEESMNRSRFVSVPEQVLRAAQRNPHAVAITSPCARLTFEDLILAASACADRFAGALAGRRGLIALATEDPAEMIIGALAAWITGCAYLPVDPNGPTLRLRHMLTEAQVQLIAVTDVKAGRIPDGDWRQIMIGQPTLLRSSRSVADEAWDASSQQLAYVIYTSGSTGQAKGAAITHGNLSHLVKWHKGAFNVSQQDRGIQFAALTFDAAVLETWPLLAAGASLDLPERSLPLTPERLRDHLVTQGITLCFASTPLAEQLISLEWPADTRLRYLLTGADTLRIYPPAGLPFRLVNNYGPTECTVLATSGVVEPDQGRGGIPSIGKPISGSEIYLADAEMRPVPDGDRGQICIGGAGVGEGYAGQPDLTAEKFMTIPWMSASPVYLTGDLARKLPNGEFEFRGRLDDQIKIRGYRIEPEEITTALREHDAISAAVVSSIGIGPAKQLIGYVVLKMSVTALELQHHLAQRVPPYMIPEHFVRLKELPMTERGKVDRAALPAPDRLNSLDATDAVAELQTETQVEVASILSTLLGVQEVGLDDNFFRLGGHSLLAAQVIARVRRAFDINLPLRSVFESPTVVSLSEEIERRILEAMGDASAEEQSETAVRLTRS
jgi:amino acid adenylation domain